VTADEFATVRAAKTSRATRERFAIFSAPYHHPMARRFGRRPHDFDDGSNRTDAIVFEENVLRTITRALHRRIINSPGRRRNGVAHQRTKRCRAKFAHYICGDLAPSGNPRAMRANWRVPVRSAQAAGVDRNFDMERGTGESMPQVWLSKGCCARAQGYWRFEPATPGGPPNAAA
jgi:hypothetical protein